MPDAAHGAGPGARTAEDVRHAGGRPPEVSVVVPAFNQAETIQANVREIARRLEERGLDFELVVVSDGSSDATHARCAEIVDGRIRALRYDRNLGKGYALRTGSQAARGEWVAWLDSDLDLDPGLIPAYLARARREEMDIVVGSKRHPDSEVDYPARRRAYSWLYQQLVRALFSLNVRDTQVGMKLFRREVLDEVLPVVLVKRYAFDLEMLAVARSFGFDRIAEAPVRLSYRFGESGVNWRAIAQALWDTAAVFYRLRLLRFYERRRTLARRVAAHRPARLPSLTVALAPGDGLEAARRAVRRIARTAPPGTRILIASSRHPDEPVAGVAGAEVVNCGPGTRHERLERVVPLVDSEVLALIDEGARPGDGWAHAALGLLGDPTVGAVVGPVVSRLGADPSRTAAGVLKESRLGVGGARVRHHVGRLHEVGDFPASNIFLRTAALQDALRRGFALDDRLCAALRSRAGLAVLCSPDVVVAADPPPLGDYLRTLHALGRDRGGRARRLRARHLLPAAVLPAAALGPAALARGGQAAGAWGVAAAAYAGAIAAFGAVILVLHRRPRVAGLAAAGAAGSHVAFGAGVLRGLAGRLAGRRRGR